MPDSRIFYSTNYLKFVEETQGVEISLFQARKNGALAFLPYYVQDDTLFSLRYGGMISNSKSKKFARFVSDRFMDHCRARKIRDIRIRNNPYINTIRIGEVIKKEPLAFINLNKAEEDLYAGISAEHKRGLVKAKSERLLIYESKELKYLVLFYRFYNKLFRRKGRRPQGYAFFEKLYNRLKENLNLVYVRDDDRVIAVSIVLESRPNVYMLYGAMAEDGYKKCAKHLLIYELMRRYKKRGYSRLILGTGADGTADSIYRFKKGFTDEGSYIYTYGAKI